MILRQRGWDDVLLAPQQPKTKPHKKQLDGNDCLLEKFCQTFQTAITRLDEKETTQRNVDVPQSAF